MELSKPIYRDIWLADDDLDDCETFKDVLKQILPSCSVTIINNGKELIELLNPTRKPDILFLDINMPYKDGLDCLIEIRAQRFFSRLPVIIFSSSNQPRDIDKSYGYGANLYYTKPSSFQQLIVGMGTIFKMNWDDPYAITSNYCINNKFIPFNPSEQV